MRGYLHHPCIGASVFMFVGAGIVVVPFTFGIGVRGHCGASGVVPFAFGAGVRARCGRWWCCPVCFRVCVVAGALLFAFVAYVLGRGG